MAGDLGEGLREDVFPPCGLAVGQDCRAPVGCDGGRCGYCDWEAACVGIVDCLAGSVGGCVSLDMTGFERKVVATY